MPIGRRLGGTGKIPPIAMQQMEQRAQMQQIGQGWRLPSRDSATSERRKTCSTAAAILLGCYRSGEAHDPEVYAAGLVSVLEQFDPAVVARVCNPATGLPSRLKFLPTLAEVRTACEELASADGRSAERRRRIEAQLAERREFEAAAENESPEHRARCVERAMAEMRASGFRFEGDPRAPAETADQVRARLGISQEAWDAIPNR